MSGKYTVTYCYVVCLQLSTIFLFNLSILFKLYAFFLRRSEVGKLCAALYRERSKLGQRFALMQLNLI